MTVRRLLNFGVPLWLLGGSALLYCLYCLAAAPGCHVGAGAIVNSRTQAVDVAILNNDLVLERLAIGPGKTTAIAFRPREEGQILIKVRGSNGVEMTGFGPYVSDYNVNDRPLFVIADDEIIEAAYVGSGSLSPVELGAICAVQTVIDLTGAK